LFNSLFKKQFALYMGVIILTFALMGVVLSRAFKSYFTTQKANSLITQGEKISDRYAAALRSRPGEIAYNINELYAQLRAVNEYLDASFILVDTGFTVIDVSADISPEHIGKTLDAEILAPVLEGEYVTAEGTIGEIFDEPMLTVCHPIIANNTVIGAILMNSPIPELQRTIEDAYRIGLICLGVSACIAFVLIFISSSAIGRRLREMSSAAKVIAGGDFDKRITTKSRDEIGMLAQSINNMAESLSKQDIARRDFLANISHDFRSPLTSIRGFLRAIEDGTVPPEKQSRYINIVLEETERLSALAEDILTLNAMSVMDIALTYTEFDINRVIKDTVVRFETGIKEKKIRITLVFSESVTYVRADREKIERVLYNLIDNALKFTPPEGKVTVETTLSAAQTLTISVKDTGPGIPDEEKARVFERFYKADHSRGEDKRGSGLGLSIAKEFIKAHGQSISLTSEPEGGCIFKFDLTTVT